jgi:hypothetical protein
MRHPNHKSAEYWVGKMSVDQMVFDDSTWRQRETTEGSARLGQKITSIGLYHPLDCIANLKYKLLRFLTPNKNKFKKKGASF